MRDVVAKFKGRIVVLNKRGKREVVREGTRRCREKFHDRGECRANRDLDAQEVKGTHCD